jgi:hypothetical protein
MLMAGGGAVRNRSQIVTVTTPRGSVEVARQEVHGLRKGEQWQWFWVARRKGRVDWSEASTVREAIRRAILLPARKPPGWLAEAAVEAERQIIDAIDGASADSPEAANAEPTEDGDAAE